MRLKAPSRRFTTKRYERSALSRGSVVAEAASPASADQNYRYSVGAKPGLYYVAAGIDDNLNGDLFDPGERAGFFPDPENPTPVRVEPGKTTEGIDFMLAPVE